MNIRISPQLRQLRSAASRYFPATADEGESRTIKLERSMYEASKALADQLGTTVQAVMREALALYAARYREGGESETSLPSHPLLLLDGLAARPLEETEGEQP